jgi:hypothetical protein
MQTILNQSTRTNNWNTVGKITGVVAVVLMMLYSFYQFRAWWRGPIIEITSPVSGVRTETSIIRIAGRTSNIAQLYIMGRPVPIELRTNNFSTEISVPEGVSTITFDGFSRYDNHTREKILVYYTPPAVTTTPDPTLDFFKSLKPIQVQFRPGSDIINSIEEKTTPLTEE